MKPLFCRCKQCRRGRYGHKWAFRKAIRGGRRAVKLMLKSGESEKLPQRIYVGYVD